MPQYYTFKDDMLILRVLLQPAAKTDEIAGIYDDNLKIRIKAPAIEGKAYNGRGFLDHFF